MKTKLSRNQIREMYDSKYALSYSKKDDSRIPGFLKFINLNKKDVIVDFACGTGLLLHHIYRDIKFYYGVDFSSEQIEYAISLASSKNISNAKFFCSEISEFCEGKENFSDKVFALDFTEHIYDDELLKIFNSIKNCMKNDALLYIHTPNGNYFLEILKNKNILKQIPQHIGVRTAQQYKFLFADILNFRNFFVYYIPHYIPLLRSFHFLSKLPIVGKYFEARLFIICQK